MFITFEGLDSSGKTTQAKLLLNRLTLHGKDVVFLREPGGTAISEKIRDILLDKKHVQMTQKAELFLFSAARTQVVTEVIQPALKKGKFVLCDRFYDSTTAYQGYGRGLNLDEVITINTIATYGTTPDLTLFIDVEINEITRRRHAAKLSTDRMESSGHFFYEKVREGYLTLVKSEPKRFVLVNGMRPIEEIHNEVWNIVQKRLL